MKPIAAANLLVFIQALLRSIFFSSDPVSKI
jgi:hypothetical protein